MKPYETIELELDELTIKDLNEKAKELNMTFDELVGAILESHISTKVTISDYKKLIEDYEEDNKKNEFLSNFYSIIDSFGEIIARIRPITE